MFHGGPWTLHKPLIGSESSILYGQQVLPFLKHNTPNRSRSTCWRSPTCTSGSGKRLSHGRQVTLELSWPTGALTSCSWSGREGSRGGAEQRVWWRVQEGGSRIFPLHLALAVLQQAALHCLMSALLAFVQQIFSKKCLLNTKRPNFGWREAFPGKTTELSLHLAVGSDMAITSQ